MELGVMISTILASAGDMIAHVVALVRGGNKAEAQEAVKRFTATTQAQLEIDRRTAEEILKERFPDSQPPEED
jgi:hypothetical protein